MWRWWGKGLVCMKSFTKYMFSLHSASFPPSLSWLSSCVCLFLCLFHSLCTPIHASVDVWICVLERLLYQNAVLHPCVSGRVSVCVCVWVFMPAGIWGSDTRWKPLRQRGSTAGRDSDIEGRFRGYKTHSHTKAGKSVYWNQPNHGVCTSDSVKVNRKFGDVCVPRLFGGVKNLGWRWVAKMHCNRERRALADIHTETFIKNPWIYNLRSPLQTLQGFHSSPLQVRAKH